MEHPIRKMVIALALAAVLLIPAYFIISDASVAAMSRETARRNYDRLDDFNRMMGDLFERQKTLDESYINNLMADFLVEVIGLKEYADNDSYSGPDTFQNGFVLRMKNGEPVYPKELDRESIPIPDEFLRANLKGDYSVLTYAAPDGQSVHFVFYARLATDVYAITVLNSGDLRAYQDTFMNTDSTIATLEEIYGGHLVLFDHNGRFKAGGSDDFLPNDSTTESAGLDLTGNPRGPRVFTREGGKWYYVFRELDSKDYKAVFFYSADTGHGIHGGSSLIVLALLALVAAGLITWHIAVQRMVRNKILVNEQFKRYHPHRVRRMAVLFGVACTAAVFLITFLYMLLTSMRVESANASETLKAVENRMKADPTLSAELQDWEQQQALATVKEAAQRMGEKPELQTKEYLKKVASAIGCEYLMIFDAQGNEILSDQDYVGFNLGTNEGDETYPFRRLLQGVETWIADPACDSVTGKTLLKIGVRMPIAGSDRYGALIVAMNPGDTNGINLQEDKNLLLEGITPADTVGFVVNRETGNIDYASEQFMRNAEAATYGITKNLLRDNETCGITNNGKTWYGASRTIGQEVWFYCMNANVLQTGNLGFALVSAAITAAFFIILAVFLLRGYTRENYEHYSTIGQEVVHSMMVEVVTADGRIKRTLDPSKRWGTFTSRWHLLDPGRKAKLVFEAVLVLIALASVVVLSSSGSLQNSLLGFIMSGHWDRSLNLFALTATMMVIGGALLLVLILKLLSQLLCMSLGSKGETILRLLINLAGYIVMIMAIYYSFVNFGIDTGGLLGAMAFVSLAVSLGSKDLVSDVLAGMTIVIEGEYQVGDIVEIEGYKGKVLEIGARTTKLLGQGDNVKIVNNRDIRNVLNLTRYNSWYAMQLDIPASCPLEKMEKILLDELPNIGKKSDMIISGPLYKGVEAIGKGSFRITILTECREDDFRSVQRLLNREIHQLLIKENIPTA